MSSRFPSASLGRIALVSIALVVVPIACDNNADGTSTSSSATATNGTGFNPPCNDNHQDGYCNAFGATPESCECLDCADTAYCKNGCKADGACDVNGGEDCTCEDCFGKQVNNDTCPFQNNQGPGPTSGPSTSSGGGMGGMSPAGSTAQATTGAATTSMSASGTGGMSSSSSG